MARAWIVDGRGFAKMVKNSGPFAAHEINDHGATVQCHNCLHMIQFNNVSGDMPGFPAGVKFDPSDVQLLDHLAAKCGMGNAEPHRFIDEFIPTLGCDKGICYTHPEYLPGAKKDGSSAHFFYKVRNAYNIGTRKRRKVQGNAVTPEVRWHKTGKTKVIVENGVRKGVKKIMVLYSTAKNAAPKKLNWVMHQFHLGSEEEEKEGVFVVAKIFYQHEKEGSEKESMSEVTTVPLDPMTPNTSAPDPPREEKTPMSDCGVDKYSLQAHVQDANDGKDLCDQCGIPVREGEGCTRCLAGSEIQFPLYNEIPDSQSMTDIFPPTDGLLTQVGNQTSDAHHGVGTGNALGSEIQFPLYSEISDSQAMTNIFPPMDGLLTQVGNQTSDAHQSVGTGNATGSEIQFPLYSEIPDSQAMTYNFPPMDGLLTQVGNQSRDAHQSVVTGNASYSDLANIQVDSPPDFKLSNLPSTFLSQEDSLFDWLWTDER